MTVKGVTSDFAFTRNPIVLRASILSEQLGKLVISNRGQIVYEGRCYLPAEINVAEVLDAFSAPVSEEAIGAVALGVEIVEDSAMLELRRFICEISADSAQGDDECEVYAIPGGVSTATWQKTLKRGRDIFDSRFLNHSMNFFLTTRRDGSHLRLKETELYPLYFFGKSDETLRVVERSGHYHFDFTLPGKGIYRMDFDALRRRFFDEFGIIPAVFSVWGGNKPACNVVIERAEATKHHTRLKFRNRLGVFEIVDLTGPLSFGPEYDTDDSTFKQYNSTADCYESVRERPDGKFVASVDTGIILQDELPYVLGLLESEEVWLLDVFPEPYKVLPSAENLLFDARPESPVSFTLKLEFSLPATDLLCSSGNSSKSGGVFTSQFTEQFT